MSHFESEEQFQWYAEQKSLEFRKRYGLDEIDPWTDELLDQALADHGFPTLASLPDRPVAKMDLAIAETPYEQMSAQERHHWQRGNAGHLLGHAMLHDARRCDACRDWGRPDADDV